MMLPSAASMQTGAIVATEKTCVATRMKTCVETVLIHVCAAHSEYAILVQEDYEAVHRVVIQCVSLDPDLSGQLLLANNGNQSGDQRGGLAGEISGDIGGDRISGMDGLVGDHSWAPLGLATQAGRHQDLFAGHLSRLAHPVSVSLTDQSCPGTVLVIQSYS